MKQTNRNRQSSIILWGFAGLFLLLGIGYSTLTPIFENSDETLHYPYIKHVADGRGLPLAEPNQLWHQEGTQPPLYYAIVAATTFWINTDNLPDHLQPNPHWRFSDVRPLINDNQNVMLHGPMDAFPYRRAALAIHIGRWWSLFFGLVTVICTFLVARYFFPTNIPLAVSATALVALTPQFIRVSATVSNDSLSAALASLTVLLALKFTHTPVQKFIPLCPPRNRHAVVLGLLAGLALLTKFSSLSVFFLAAFITFWRNFFITEIHQRPLQKLARWLLIMAAVMALLTGWWFWRNYQLYGEWLAIETHLNLAGRGHLTLSDVWNLRAEIERAYWATFGWGQIRLPEWVYQLLGGFTRLGLLGLGLAVIAKLVQGEKVRPIPLNLSSINLEIILFLLFWAALNLLLYARWVMAVGSVSHTRLIFPAITAISLLLALGWHALLPQRLHIWFSGLLTAGLLALNIYSLGWLIYPAFTPTNAIEDEGAANDINLTFLDSLQLTGGGVSPQTATPGDTIRVNAQWHTQAVIDKNYSVSVVLLAPDGAVLARRESYPGLGLRPTRYLTPGDSFTDTYPLKLTADVSEPVVAQVIISLFDFESETRAGFPAFDAAGNEVTAVVGHLKIKPAVWPQHQPEQATDVNFANAIKLTGYDLLEAQAEAKENESNSINPANPLTLKLYWTSLAAVDEDYNLFIHLLDDEGHIVVQADAPVTNNVYPTRWWSPGETIAGAHPLPNAPAATRIRLGLYSLTTGNRLPIIEADLPHQDNSIDIKLQSHNKR